MKVHALFTLCLAVIAMAAAPTYAADEPTQMGRLFHTPHKRAILDSLRGRDIRIPPEQQFNSVRLDGIVRRSGGASTVWINGVPHHDKAPLEHIGQSSARVFAGENRNVEVKVGQTVKISPSSAGAAQ